MPNSEYESNSGGVNAFVEIVSSQSDITGVSLFDSIIASAWEEEEVPEADCGGEFIMRSECVLCERDGRVILSYEENLPEEPSSTAVISFMRDCPEIITVSRNGESSSSFVIEAGKRSYSVYSTPFGTMDICIFGKRVENTVTSEGGALTLDYAVELKGMTAQRTKMKITVRKNS